MTRQRLDSISQLNKTLPIPIELHNGETLESHRENHLSHITDVLVGENHIIKGENGGIPYTVWQIKVIINELNLSSIILYKRYTEFVKLKQDLEAYYKDDHILIPELPAKDSFRISRIMLNNSWLEQRRKGLQWFLSNVLLDPLFQNSSVIKDFVLNK